MDTRKQIGVKRTRSVLAGEVHGVAPKKHKGIDYVQLKHDMPLQVAGKYACCGAMRESILLDMESDELKNIFIPFYATLQDDDAATQPVDAESDADDLLHPPKFNVADHIDYVLDRIVHYVYEIFYDKSTAAQQENEIKKIIKKLEGGNEIKLEDIISKNNNDEYHAKGLCRHAALLTGYLLVKTLQMDNSEIVGSVFRFRTNLVPIDASPAASSALFSPREVGHAVIIYVTEKGQHFLLDSTRHTEGHQGLAINLNELDADGREILQKNYKHYDTALFAQQIKDNYSSAVLAGKPSPSSSP
jgi:hypothetical protein